MQQLEDHNTNSDDGAMYGYDERLIWRIREDHTVIEPRPTSSADPGYAFDNRGAPVYLDQMEHQQRRRPPDVLHKGPRQLARTTSRDAPTLSKCYLFEGTTFKPSMQIKTIFSLYI